MPTTLADVFDFVNEYIAKEGAEPAPHLYPKLYNMALSSIIGPVVSWRNTDSVVGVRTFNIPSDIRTLDYVMWDGYKLERTTRNWLDTHDSGWDARSGTPARFVWEINSLILDRAPTTSREGILRVCGEGDWPEAKLSGTSPDAFDLIPERFKMTPAYFIISNLPVGPEQNRNQNNARQAAAARWERERRSWNFHMQSLRGEAFKL